jgi:hypothetical protein
VESLQPSNFDKYLDYIRDRLCGPEARRTAFLFARECADMAAYRDHLVTMHRMLQKWGLPGAPGAALGYLPALVAFHGIGTADLPGSLQTDDAFMALHGRLRQLIRQHEETVRQGRTAARYQALQRSLEAAEARHVGLLAVFLANSMSLFQQRPAIPRSPERMENAAGLFLEVIRDMAMEKGLFTDANVCGDRALEILNPETARGLRERLAFLRPRAEHLCEQISGALPKDLAVPASFFFLKRYRHSVARELGILFGRHPDIVDTCRLSDLIRLYGKVESRADAFRVLEALTRRFSADGLRIRDFTRTPKPSGYRGLHFRLPVWLHHAGDRPEISGPDDPFAECQFFKFAILLPQGAGVVVDGDHRVAWLDRVAAPSGGVTVYTRAGEARTVPRGATLLDFAFQIHTEVGLQCVGGQRLDGRGCALDPAPLALEYPLREGDRLSIQTDPAAPGPDISWFQAAKTRYAREKIRRHLRSRGGRRAFQFLARIWLTAYDRPGLAHDLSGELAERGLQAAFFRAESMLDGRAEVEMEVHFSESEMEENIRRRTLIDRFYAYPDVLSVDVLQARYSRTGALEVVDRPPADWGANPVDLAFFAGRTAERHALANWYWNRPETPCMAVSGFYRAGKTSLCAMFSQEYRARIFSLYVNFSFLSQTMAEADLIRDIHRQLREQIRRRCDPELLDGLEECAADREAVREILFRFVQFAARRGKGVLVVFDDVDVLEESPFASLLDRFLELNKFLTDRLRFEKGPVSPPRFLIAGQYRLYRHLRRRPARGRWAHLPIRRHIGRNACVDFANRRMEFHRKRFPAIPRMPDFGEWVVRWVGRAPQDLANFLELFFQEFQSGGGPAGMDSPAACRERVVNQYYRILADRHLYTEIYEQLEKHYLENEENRDVARILEALARSPEKGLPEEALSDWVSGSADWRERVVELNEFGFIERRRAGNRRWVHLYKSLTADFLCGHFSQPFFKRNVR